jgi:hypothetical protein
MNSSFTTASTSQTEPKISAQSFAQLGDQFLLASTFIHDGFKSTPKTYEAAFQALEYFLKAYLLLKGATHNDFGPNVRHALQEAKAKGLVLKVDPNVEDTVMKVSDHYADGRFSPAGEWLELPPQLVITFVDQVRRDARL